MDKPVGSTARHEHPGDGLPLRNLHARDLRWSGNCKRRERRIDLLLETTCSGDYDPWVQFFAEAVETQAAQAAQTIQELLSYRDEVLATLRLGGVRGSALEIAAQLIGYPVLDVGTAKLMIDKSFEAANQAVARLVQHKVLREVTGKRMNRIFACPTVIAIVNRRPARS